MRKQLEAKLQRFEELEKLLVDPEVLADSARMSAIYREHGSLAKLATKYRRFKELNTQIADAMAMVEGDDPELRELAKAELVPQAKRLGIGIGLFGAAAFFSHGSLLILSTVSTVCSITFPCESVFFMIPFLSGAGTRTK